MPPLFAALAVDGYGEESVMFTLALTTEAVLTLGRKTGQKKTLVVHRLRMTSCSHQQPPPPSCEAMVATGKALKCAGPPPTDAAGISLLAVSFGFGHEFIIFLFGVILYSGDYCLSP